MLMEIFKTGVYQMKSGPVSFSKSDLEEIVSVYSERIKFNDFAPIVKGHPTVEAPAHGWIDKLKISGEILLASARDLSSEIINDIKFKRYRNVSVSLLNKSHLVHVGLLGAVPPAVKGLEPLQLSDNQTVLSFNFSGFSLVDDSQDKIDFATKLNSHVLSGKLKPTSRDFLLQLYDDYVQVFDVQKAQEKLLKFSNLMGDNLELSNLETSKIGTLPDDFNDRQALHEFVTNYATVNNVNYAVAFSRILKERSK